MVNSDMNMYKIAGPIDVPEIMPIIWREDRDVGVNCVGEPPAVPMPGAVATAVANAIGVQVRSMPLTPDKVLAALGGKEAQLESVRLSRGRGAGAGARRARRGKDAAQGGRHRPAGPHEGAGRRRRIRCCRSAASKELRYIREDADGVHIGCLTTLADIGRSDLLRSEVRRAARGGGRSGNAADSRAGHAGRQHLPAAAVLVLPQEGVQLPEKGRPHVLCRSKARTSSTPSSAAGRPTSCIHRTRRRRWWRSMRRSSCGQPRAATPADQGGRLLRAARQVGDERERARAGPGGHRDRPAQGAVGRVRPSSCARSKASTGRW